MLVAVETTLLAEFLRCERTSDGRGPRCSGKGTEGSQPHSR